MMKMRLAPVIALVLSACLMHASSTAATCVDDDRAIEELLWPIAKSCAEANTIMGLCARSVYGQQHCPRTCGGCSSDNSNNPFDPSDDPTDSPTDSPTQAYVCADDNASIARILENARIDTCAEAQSKLGICHNTAYGPRSCPLTCGICTTEAPATTKRQEEDDKSWCKDDNISVSRNLSPVAITCEEARDKLDICNSSPLGPQICPVTCGTCSQLTTPAYGDCPPVRMCQCKPEAHLVWKVSASGCRFCLCKPPGNGHDDGDLPEITTTTTVAPTRPPRPTSGNCKEPVCKCRGTGVPIYYKQDTGCFSCICSNERTTVAPTTTVEASSSSSSAPETACVPRNGDWIYTPWTQWSATCGPSYRFRGYSSCSASCGGTCPEPKKVDFQSLAVCSSRNAGSDGAGTETDAGGSASSGSSSMWIYIAAGMVVLLAIIAVIAIRMRSKRNLGANLEYDDSEFPTSTNPMYGKDTIDG